MAFNTEHAKMLHRHVVIWVEKHIDEPNNNEKMKDRLRRITYPLETFSDVQSAMKFIREQQAAQMSVFLIVSGTLAVEIVPQIADVDCVIQVFIFCGKTAIKCLKLGVQYTEKVLLFDCNEALLIRLTNEIANHLMEEANKYVDRNKVKQAADLLDWAAWLYNDADTLSRTAYKEILVNIDQRRLQLNIDYKIVHPNRFNT